MLMEPGICNVQIEQEIWQLILGESDTKSSTDSKLKVPTNQTGVIPFDYQKLREHRGRGHFPLQ